MKAVLFYNPKCATCRNVLAGLKAHGIAPTLLEYLDTPPTESVLDDLLKKMGSEPLSIVRQKEPVYQEKFAGKTLSRAQWLKTLHENPQLIERPILVLDNRAAVIRPAEKLEQFLQGLG